MNAPRHREFACAIIIDTHGRFLLQQREDVPGILFPGKIGLFGGHREGSESFLQCVVREVREEISYFVSPERFEHMESFRGADSEIEGGTIRGECYVVRDVPVDAITVAEGSLFIAAPEDMPMLMQRLTPSAQAAIGLFLNNARRVQISN